MVTPSNENIDFSTWPVEEQEEAFQELSSLLNKPPGFDPVTATDSELVTMLSSITEVIKTRPTATISQSTLIEFGPLTISVVN